MKKIYGFAALCAAMTLASCSNENEPNVVDNGPLQPVYMNVAISGAMGTRAMSDAAATDAEVAVKSATFVLFDADGKAIGTKTLAENELTWTNGNADAQITETATKKVEFAIKPNVSPAYVVCVLNKDIAGDVSTSGTQTTVTDVREMATSYGSASDGFVMSNAALEGTEEKAMYCTAVAGFSTSDTDDIATTTIYVERVAARVGYYTNGETYAADAKVTTADETPVEVTVEIQTVTLGNTTSNAGLIKDVDGLTDYADATYHRSHGANQYKNVEWSDNPTLIECKKDAALAVVSSTSPAFVSYAYENVDANKLTQVIVTGRLKVDGNYVDDEHPICKVEGGAYYTYAGMQAFINKKLDVNGYRIKTSTGDRSLTEDDWTLVAGYNTYDGYVALNDLAAGETLLKNGVETTVAAANSDFKGSAENHGQNFRVDRYTNGLCYYFATINGGTGSCPGIVRNHVYNIGLNAVAGLGIPMFDPTKNIDPEIPTPFTGEDPENWYLNCSINVLNWAVYTQDINFGTEQGY